MPPGGVPRLRESEKDPMRGLTLTCMNRGVSYLHHDLASIGIDLQDINSKS